MWRLDFFQQAATLPLAADDGNAEESIAWLSDVADVSGMLHEASYRLWERSGMHWPQDLGESPKEASEVSKQEPGYISRPTGPGVWTHSERNLQIPQVIRDAISSWRL